MNLEELYTKLEEQEPLTTREEKKFTDDVTRGIDELGNIIEENTEQ